MVYLASTLSLAALEYLVHVDPEDVPDDLVAIAIALPSTATIDAWTASDLPVDWRQATAPLSCQELGDAWATGGRALGLLVPSVLVPEETNLLLNPKHALMPQVEITQVRRFVYDPRLIG